MGDTYRPHGGYASSRRRDDDYHQQDRYYDRGDHGRVQYDEPYRPPREYNFRGAAERPLYEQRRPQEEFSFRAPGPHFPPQDPRDTRQPAPQRSRNGRYDERARTQGEPRPIDAARQRHAHNHNHNQRGRGRGGFRSRAAHTRDILKASGREPTPEQLEGMNAEGNARYRDVDSSSEDSEDSEGSEAGEVVDLTQDSDDDVPRKRAKLDNANESAAPKWSNPDPYTALPPPESLGAPKKDIVQTIRKAKNDAQALAGGNNAVQGNADFISLNFEDDFGDGNVSDGSDEMDADPIDLTSSTPPKPLSNFSHRTDFHATIPSAQTAPSSFTAANQPQSSRTMDFDSSLPGQIPGFVMPTDEESAAQLLNDGRGMKRKRRDEKAKSKGDILDEWQINESDPTPWCKVDHSQTSNTGLRLHKEICDFYNFVRPYDYEEAVRRDLIQRIQYAIRTSSAKGANNVNVHCFGSFAAGVYLPTADMDLVAMSPSYMSYGQKLFGQSSSQMHRMAKDFNWSGVSVPGGVVVISRAKVPIVKFADKRTGIKVDISFENDSGVIANKTFQTWKAQFPAMPGVVVLVKQLLAMRGLNEVFTGGIGGFTTICLVVSMMQLMPELQSANMNGQMHYGELFMNFLDLYGNKFDMERTGIRMDPPGYFDKVKNPAPKQNMNRLTIIDPNNPNNDISGGSHEIEAVLDAFRLAHSHLQRRLAHVHAGRDVEDSILGCVLGGNYTSFTHQREKLSLLHRGYRVSPPPPPAPKPVKSGRNRGQEKRQGVAANANNRAPIHALPPRPNGQTHTVPPKPTRQTRSSNEQNGNLELDSIAQLKKQAAIEKKNDARRTSRAVRFKQGHPEIVGVPDKMTKGEAKKLRERLGSLAEKAAPEERVGSGGQRSESADSKPPTTPDVGSNAQHGAVNILETWRPGHMLTKAEKKEVLLQKKRNRVIAWKQAHPGIANVPDTFSIADIHKFNELYGFPKRSVAWQKHATQTGEHQPDL